LRKTFLHPCLTKGYGERRLIYPENTEIDHALNRRVEVRILSCCKYSND
jgi:hypothetical protein